MSGLIAMVTDLHLGVKKANELFLDSQMRFFKNQFEPYLRENCIKEVFVLGDIFDNRVHINIKIKNEALDLFGNILKDYKIYMLVGNHDTYNSTSIKVNALKFLNNLKNVTVIENNTIVNLYNKKILLSPWIVDVNDFKNDIGNIQERVDICMGHFAINGFYLNKYKIEDNGMSVDSFGKFKKLFSGHFHTRNTRIFNDTEMVYIGSPYQLNKGDDGEDRGFCVLNVNTLNYKFINNNCSIKYTMLNYPEPFTKEMICGNLIDVNVKFDKSLVDDDLQTYIKNIDLLEPIATPTIIPINTFDEGVNSTEFKSVSSNDLVKEYIDSLDIEDKDSVYVAMQRLYEDAKNILY